MATGGSQHKVEGLTHYERNKEIYIKKTRKRNKKIRERIRDKLRKHKDKPCMDCDIKYPYYVMDLDHRNPKEKIIGPSKMISAQWSDEHIDTELKKCDVVCANCHRERTQRQRE